MGRGRISSWTFVRYLVLCSLLLIAFLLYLRIEEESIPSNSLSSKELEINDFSLLINQHLANSYEKIDKNESSEKALNRVNWSYYKITQLLNSNKRHMITDGTV